MLKKTPTIDLDDTVIDFDQKIKNISNIRGWKII